jgi:hypothetical protein
VSKNAKISKNRHPGECRGPEDVDFIKPTALDPGIRRGDGVFFDTLLIQITMNIFGFYVGAASAAIRVKWAPSVIAAEAAPTLVSRCHG